MKTAKLVLGIFLLAASGQNIAARPITLTPAESLVLNGVNVTQGIFTLVTAETLDVSATNALGQPVFDDLTANPISVPVNIGSGSQFFLFDGPEQFLPLNIFGFFFQAVNPIPIGLGTIGTVVVSALPQLRLSLPSETDVPFSFQITDVAGNTTFANGLNFSLTPDPSAAQNIDIFGNGSLYVTLNQQNLEFRNVFGNLITPNFQPFGSIGGFAVLSEPTTVPLPAAGWLLLSGLLGWFCPKHVFRRK